MDCKSFCGTILTISCLFGRFVSIGSVCLVSGMFGWLFLIHLFFVGGGGGVMLLVACSWSIYSGWF